MAKPKEVPKPTAPVKPTAKPVVEQKKPVTKKV
jgi:hypothetical protein